MSFVFSFSLYVAKKKYAQVVFIFFYLFIFINKSNCQNFVINLNTILSDYCFTSPEAIKAKLYHENSNYIYDNFKKGFLPSIAFSLRPASFNRSYRVLQNPTDGSYSYVEDFANNSSVGMSVSQKIGITGGTINVGSNLNMLNEFYNKRNSFSTQPFSIGYSQMLFGGAAADFKFTKKIEQKKNAKAAKDYCSSITNIQREAVWFYMDLFLAKVAMELAIKNEALSDTLLRASSINYENGRMAENEYLQMQIQAANDRFATENYKKEFETYLRRLLDYLGITDIYNEYIIESPNFDLPIILNFDMVIEYAEKNSPFTLGQNIKFIETEKSIHSARFQDRFKSNINFNWGMNQYAPVFTDAYKNAASQQSISIGLQIPVFQWGISKNNFKIAENNYEISLMEIDREYVSFYNDLKEKVNNYNHNVNLMTIAESSFELAVKQYEMSVNKFDLGKLSIYELGLIQRELFSSMNRYFMVMKDVWDMYYSLRSITLFDFVEKKELIEILVQE